KKITHLSRLKIRWLNIQTLILLLFGLLFSFFQGQAQTYCTPQYYDGCDYDDDLNSIIITGHGTSVLSDLNTGCAANAYSDRTTTTTAVDLMQGQSYSVQMNTTYSFGSDEYAYIWIDFNNDGTFSSNEKLLSDFPLISTPSFATTTIAIPANAVVGIHRMRVRVVYSPWLTPDACSLEDYGETHDYNVNILALPSCTGPVSAGVASASVTNACASVPFSVSLTGATMAGGITYQWQSSPVGAGTFTNIQGATSTSYTVANQTIATDYRCVVVCTNGNTTDISNTVSVAQNPITQCYCTPTYSYT